MKSNTLRVSCVSHVLQRVCVCVLVDSVSTVSTPSQDSAAKAVASKPGSEIDAEDEELKSQNLRSNQAEAKDNVGLVST